jgi:hypothetical protein
MFEVVLTKILINMQASFRQGCRQYRERLNSLPYKTSGDKLFWSFLHISPTTTF